MGEGFLAEVGWSKIAVK